MKPRPLGAIELHMNGPMTLLTVIAMTLTFSSAARVDDAPRPDVPAFDAAQPKEVKTATFALG